MPMIGSPQAFVQIKGFFPYFELHSFGQRFGIFLSQEIDIYPNLTLLRLLMHFYCKEVSKDEFLKIEQVIQ